MATITTIRLGLPTQTRQIQSKANESLPKRVQSFVMNGENYKRAILEGAFLYAATPFAPVAIGGIIAASTACDLAARLITPARNSATISYFTTIWSAFAFSGNPLPLALALACRL